MRMFGFTTLPLNVTCDASLNFVNTDVMLVLDVTGSMDDTTSTAPATKIVALRDAVMALYDELAPIQTQLEANGLRLRYGIVPYSSTVNVGALIRAMNPDLSGRQRQLSVARSPITTSAYRYVGTRQPPEPPVDQTYGSSISQSDCDKYGRNVSFSRLHAQRHHRRRPGADRDLDAAPSRTTKPRGVDWGWSGASDTSGTNRSCRRRYVETDTHLSDQRYRYESSGWIYEPEVARRQPVQAGQCGPITIDDQRRRPVRPLRHGRSTTRSSSPARRPATTTTNDHLERLHRGARHGQHDHRRPRATRSRRAPTTSTSTSIPTNDDDALAADVPGRRSTAAPPARPRPAAARSMADAACPAAARRLQAWTRGDMQTYVNALTPTGSTYHDIGMIWGARMLSNGGIFADSPDTFNGMPVSRHIIFMTDGQMDTDRDIYALLRHRAERPADQRHVDARRRASSTAATCSASR